MIFCNWKVWLSESLASYKVYNIGNNQPVQLEKFISVLEEKIGKKAIRNYMEMQPGDVIRTYADTSDLEKAIDFKPSTSIEEGLENFTIWYKEFYNIEENKLKEDKDLFLVKNEI